MNPLLQKLTIAIPVYNDEKYIAATLESCVAQAGRIVICDNCSTDKTSAICAEFAAKHPHITHLRWPENLGAFENFKRPLFDCTTEYFCWLGAHDILGENYALPLLEALEADRGAALAGGTIDHIGEQGERLNDTTRSDWANESKDETPLVRAGECATRLRRDCSIFYGIYRAEIARAAWLDVPALGFDRAMVVRTAALGKILYVPQSMFYARDFPVSRPKTEDRNRRILELSRDQKKPLAKNLFVRNMSMVQTVLAQAKTPEDLTIALRYVDKINRRYQNRRYYQKLRLAKIAAAVAVVFVLIAAVAR